MPFFTGGHYQCTAVIIGFEKSFYQIKVGRACDRLTGSLQGIPSKRCGTLLPEESINKIPRLYHVMSLS
jgi:hypothetical protein